MRFSVSEYVRWEDIDAAGIINYQAYLRFFGLAEVELFRSCGLSYKRLFDDLGVGFVDLVVYLSRGLTLRAGDVIATGTPGGVGDSRTPPRYLRDGDVVEVAVEGVGTLRNSVRLERA